MQSSTFCGPESTLGKEQRGLPTDHVHSIFDSALCGLSTLLTYEYAQVTLKSCSHLHHSCSLIYPPSTLRISKATISVCRLVWNTAVEDWGIGPMNVSWQRSCNYQLVRRCHQLAFPGNLSAAHSVDGITVTPVELRARVQIVWLHVSRHFLAVNHLMSTLRSRALVSLSSSMFVWIVNCLVPARSFRCHRVVKISFHKYLDYAPRFWSSGEGPESWALHCIKFRYISRGNHRTSRLVATAITNPLWQCILDIYLSRSRHLFNRATVPS